MDEETKEWFNFRLRCIELAIAYAGTNVLSDAAAFFDFMIAEPAEDNDDEQVDEPKTDETTRKDN
jgi:hypothetical protein